MVNFVGSGTPSKHGGPRHASRVTIFLPLLPFFVVPLSFLSSFSFAHREYSRRDSACVSTCISLTEIFHFRPNFFYLRRSIKMQAFFMSADTSQSVNATLLNSFATYNYHTRWHTTSLSAKFIVRRHIHIA